MTKIYYNLYESKYMFVYEEYIFVFSSQFYLNNFRKKYKEYLIREKEKLECRFQSTIKCEVVLLIELYRKIEKRGFLIKYKNEELKIKDYLFTVKLND